MYFASNAYLRHLPVCWAPLNLSFPHWRQFLYLAVTFQWSLSISDEARHSKNNKLTRHDETCGQTERQTGELTLSFTLVTFLKKCVLSCSLVGRLVFVDRIARRETPQVIRLQLRKVQHLSPPTSSRVSNMIFSCAVPLTAIYHFLSVFVYPSIYPILYFCLCLSSLSIFVCLLSAFPAYPSASLILSPVYFCERLIKLQ